MRFWVLFVVLWLFLVLLLLLLWDNSFKDANVYKRRLLIHKCTNIFVYINILRYSCMRIRLKPKTKHQQINVKMKEKVTH